MPELPEVAFARSSLERWLGGQELLRVEVKPNRVLRGTPVRSFARLRGRRLDSIERRGKWLFFHFDGDLALLAHLGMTGKFELQLPRDPPVRFSRARFVRGDGAVVHYRDPRQFGRLWLGDIADVAGKTSWSELGPDAYEPEITPAHLARLLATTPRKIKDVLMDQTVIAGLGNIQVTDALYLARIHPARPTMSLTPSEIKRLAQAIHTSLERTIAMNQGDKIVYVEETKRIENPFFIYGKAGAPCPRCRNILQKLVIAQRTSAYCPHCQPLRPVSASRGSG